VIFFNCTALEKSLYPVLKTPIQGWDKGRGFLGSLSLAYFATIHCTKREL